MVEVKASVLVKRPIEEVFAFVTKPENDAQWYIGVESRDHTPDEPAGVGSTSQSTIRFLGVPIEVTWQVDEYDPPNKIGVKAIEGPIPVEADYTFEATDEGQTKVAVKGTADTGKVFSLADPLVERMAQRQWEASFENLKDVLES